MHLAPILQKVLIGAITYILLSAMILLGITPEQHDIQIGAPATMDILATKDVNDVVTTEEHREAAAAAVEPSYKSVDDSVVGLVIADIQSQFSTLLALRDSTTSEQALGLTDEQFETLNTTLPFNMTREQYVMLVGMYNLRHAQTAFQRRDQPRARYLKRHVAGRPGICSGRSHVPFPVRFRLRRPLSLPCHRGHAQLRQAKHADRRRNHRGQPPKGAGRGRNGNLRQGRSDRSQGRYRHVGQHPMLSSLGLLKEDSLDIPLYAGIALIVLLIMGCLALYMHRFDRDMLQPKPLTLLCLIYVLVVAFSLGVSRWNTYLMPVSLGMMLVALLLDHRLALYVNLSLGFTTSLLTDASTGLFTMTMFSVVLMAMVSGPLILTVFSHRMQRTSTLLAGVWLGISGLGHAVSGPDQQRRGFFRPCQCALVHVQRYYQRHIVYRHTAAVGVAV